MSFGNKFTLPIVITPPAGDARIPVLRADKKYTVEAAYLVPDTTIAGSTADYVSASLENGGTAGTAQEAVAPVIGGTPGWTANTPKAFTVASGSGDLAKGEYLNLFYDRTGTPTVGRFTLFLEVVEGIGSKAG